MDELFSFRQDKQNIRDTLDRLDTWTDRADRTDAVDRTGQDRTGQDSFHNNCDVLSLFRKKTIDPNLSNCEHFVCEITR